MTHDYPPACNGCGLEVPTDEDGLCKACALLSGWFDGMAAYNSLSTAGSREIAEITLKRKDKE